MFEFRFAAAAIALCLAAGPAVATPQEAVVAPVHGETRTVRDWKIVDGKLTAAQPGQFELPVAGLWRLSVVGRPGKIPKQDAGPFVVLRDGTRLAAKIVAGDVVPAGFSLDFASLGKGTVPKQYVSGIRFATPKGEPGAKPEDDGGFLADLKKPPVEHDLLFFQVKDRVRKFRGEVHGSTKEGLEVTLGGEKQVFPFERVYGVVFGELSGLVERPEGTGRTIVRFWDGTKIRGDIVAASPASGIELAVFEDLTLVFPCSWVHEIELISDQLVYVSDLKPTKVEQTPMLQRTWPILEDHGLAGRPLALGSREYRHGFLVVPDAALEYSLPAKSRWLAADVGMPAAQVGSARLRLLADGKPLASDYELTPGAPPRQLELELGKARTLRIEVRGGDDLDAGAIVILGNIRILRRAQPPAPVR